MKLTHVHITNFRCIDDSNPVEIATNTCLVGKNESGKTAFLKALEGLRSVDPGYRDSAVGGFCLRNFGISRSA